MMQANDYRRLRLVLRERRLPPNVVAERVRDDRAKSACTAEPPCVIERSMFCTAPIPVGGVGGAFSSPPP